MLVVLPLILVPLLVVTRFRASVHLGKLSQTDITNIRIHFLFFLAHCVLPAIPLAHQVWLLRPQTLCTIYLLVYFIFLFDVFLGPPHSLHLVFGTVQAQPHLRDVAVGQQEVRQQLVEAFRLPYLSPPHELVRYSFHLLLRVLVWPVLEHVLDRLHRLRLILAVVFSDIGDHAKEVPANQQTDVSVPFLEPLWVVRFYHDLIQVPLLDYHHPLPRVLQSSIVEDFIHLSHRKHLLDPEPPILLILFYSVSLAGHLFPDCFQGSFILKHCLHLLQSMFESSVEEL